jgi:hypothetical protein
MGFVTTYTYTTDTAAGNASKVTVLQGAQTRTFETDWLGRTTSVVQPESGTTSYSYAYSSTAGLGLTVTRMRPPANQGSTQTTTTTQYDSVGRVVNITYSDGTPSRGFGYDVGCCWALTGTNQKGRLAVTGGGSGSTWNGSYWSYDAMGRVVNMWSCGPASCGTSYQYNRSLGFAYDLAGNLTQSIDGSTGTINYGRSIAGEVTSITNATYQNLPYNPPNLVSNVVNGADGQWAECIPFLRHAGPSQRRVGMQRPGVPILQWRHTNLRNQQLPAWIADAGSGRYAERGDNLWLR